VTRSGLRALREVQDVSRKLREEAAGLPEEI